MEVNEAQMAEEGDAEPGGSQNPSSSLSHDSPPPPCSSEMALNACTDGTGGGRRLDRGVHRRANVGLPPLPPRRPRHPPPRARESNPEWRALFTTNRSVPIGHGNQERPRERSLPTELSAAEAQGRPRRAVLKLKLRENKWVVVNEVGCELDNQDHASTQRLSGPEKGNLGPQLQPLSQAITTSGQLNNRGPMRGQMTESDHTSRGQRVEPAEQNQSSLPSGIPKNMNLGHAPESLSGTITIGDQLSIAEPMIRDGLEDVRAEPEELTPSSRSMSIGSPEELKDLRSKRKRGDQEAGDDKVPEDFMSTGKADGQETDDNREPKELGSKRERDDQEMDEDSP